MTGGGGGITHASDTGRGPVSRLTLTIHFRWEETPTMSSCARAQVQAGRCGEDLGDVIIKGDDGLTHHSRARARGPVSSYPPRSIRVPV